jgi:predicted nucleic acid-binding protein
VRHGRRRHDGARGKTVRKTIDCLIAIYCLLHDHALLHYDRDFDPFEAMLGLQVVDPGAIGG